MWVEQQGWKCLWNLLLPLCSAPLATSRALKRSNISSSLYSVNPFTAPDVARLFLYHISKLHGRATNSHFDGSRLWLCFAISWSVSYIVVSGKGAQRSRSDLFLGLSPLFLGFTSKFCVSLLVSSTPDKIRSECNRCVLGPDVNLAIRRSMLFSNGLE